jgi:hypothetical protein
MMKAGRTFLAAAAEGTLDAVVVLLLVVRVPMAM